MDWIVCFCTSTMTALAKFSRNCNCTVKLARSSKNTKSTPHSTWMEKKQLSKRAPAISLLFKICNHKFSCCIGFVHWYVYNQFFPCLTLRDVISNEIFQCKGSSQLHQVSDQSQRMLPWSSGHKHQVTILGTTHWWTSPIVRDQRNPLDTDLTCHIVDDESFAAYDEQWWKCPAKFCLKTPVANQLLHAPPLIRKRTQCCHLRSIDRRSCRNWVGVCSFVFVLRGVCSFVFELRRRDRVLVVFVPFFVWIVLRFIIELSPVIQFFRVPVVVPWSQSMSLWSRSQTVFSSTNFKQCRWTDRKQCARRPIARLGRSKRAVFYLLTLLPTFRCTEPPRLNYKKTWPARKEQSNMIYSLL